ncbi:MAG: DUF2461 domain-containing protein [Pseudomonadota bacterium]
MAAFDCFSSEALRFLTDLDANNTKDWFAANKATYEVHLKEPSKRFADVMALALRDLTGHDHDSKVFRIHRDVRFSKNKTPYNAHLHLAFIPCGMTAQPPMWFFGLSPAKLSLGCGVFQYDKEGLPKFRSAMAGAMGAELIQLTADLQAKGIRVADPELRRVPPAFDKDHRNAEALRRKGFAAWIDVGNPSFAAKPNLVERTVDLFRELMPVYRGLSRIA